MISAVKNSTHTCHVATINDTAASTPRTWRTSGHGNRPLRLVTRLMSRGSRTRGVRTGPSAMDAAAHGRAAIRAVAHPTACALAEVVIDARARARADQQRDRLGRRHEACGVQGHPGGVAGTETEQRVLLGNVPVRIAGADAIGDRDPGREALVAEHVVDVFGETLDGARADTIEHRCQRQL